MKVVITGSRDWHDRRAIVQKLLELPEGSTVIHGDSGNADKCAKHAALALGFQCFDFRADWHIHGKAAGPMRNRRMLEQQPDKVLAFRLNMSRGTSDCIRQAMERGIPVEIDDREQDWRSDPRLEGMR